eukprot:Rhum_TRINITY_DN12947_c3_g1::Rhum_TRINITY_DN12947_c3_g1_i1::g.55755::m.55755
MQEDNRLQHEPQPSAAAVAAPQPQQQQPPPSDVEEEEEEEAEGDDASGGSSMTLREPVCGVLNVGNTCYLASGVQVVANAAVLREAAQAQRGEELSRRLRGCTDARRQALVQGWRELVHRMAGSNGTPIDPRGFVYSVMGANQQFLGFAQQDSHEFLSALLAALDDELREPFHLPAVLASFTHTAPTAAHARRQLQVYAAMHSVFNENVERDRLHAERAAFRKGKLASGGSGAYYPRLHRSVVSEIYEGRYCSCVRCTSCGGESLRVEPFTMLHLEVPTNSQTKQLRVEIDRRRRTRLAHVRAVVHNSNNSNNNSASGSSGSPVISHTDVDVSVAADPTSASPTSGGEGAEAGGSSGGGGGGGGEVSRGGLLQVTWGVIGGFAVGLMGWVMGALYLFSLAGGGDGAGGSGGGGVTLYDCLAAHFQAETIPKYDCPHCDVLSDGVKQLSLLDLPDQLVVTFKRFSKSGYWMGKLGHFIGFPVANFAGQQQLLEYPEGYSEDGSPAASPDASVSASAAASDSSSPRQQQPPPPPPPQSLPNVDPVFLDLRDYCYLSSAVSLPVSTTYRLHGMIVHRGSYHGGHYVSYVYSQRFNTWVLCNDDSIGQVDPQAVAGEAAYVLVYQKTAKKKDPTAAAPADAATPTASAASVAESTAEVDEPSAEVAEFYRVRCRRLLGHYEEAGVEGVVGMLQKQLREDPVFISRQWLVRFVHTEEPGLICNLPSYEFDEAKRERYSRSALEYYVPIPKEYWNFFIETYGGGPTVSLNAYLRMRTRQETTSEAAD